MEEVVTRDTVLVFKAPAKDWAKVYAVMGKANGDFSADSVWVTLMNFFDPQRFVYDAMIYPKTGGEALDYSEYQKEFESELFDQTDKYALLSQLEKDVYDLKKSLGII